MVQKSQFRVLNGRSHFTVFENRYDKDTSFTQYERNGNEYFLLETVFS